MRECCDNCRFAVYKIDIDGLIICELDGCVKDKDMPPCEGYKERPSFRWHDPEW